jgi:omega-6 fatty acid desaturase (delta-12 desaturase)
MTQDQVFVPKTRSDLHLPPLDPSSEDPRGSSISDEVRKELWDALGDSPIGATLQCASYLVCFLPKLVELQTNIDSVSSLEVGPFICSQMLLDNGGTLLAPAVSYVFFDQVSRYFDTILQTSNLRPSCFLHTSLGRLSSLMLASSSGSLPLLRGRTTRDSYKSSLSTLFLTCGQSQIFSDHSPVLNISVDRVNHWLVLITFLQHTDPYLPHYRAPEFTFPRGALSTLDRDLLGDCGKLMAWIGAHATHGISETHVLHHVSSKIPHYNA